MATEKSMQILEEIKTLTILELADLVKALEEEFGVSAAPVAVAGDGVKVTAPMPGNILNVNVTAGQAVKKGDVMFILEAMKMENEIVAPEDGVFKQILAQKGATVDTDEVLAVI